MSERVPCFECGVSILPETHANCGGTCMPCFKASHGGRTPRQLRVIEATNSSDVVRRWEEHCQAPFPNIETALPDDLCPISLRVFAAGCVSSFLNRGSLDRERTVVLKQSEAGIVRLLPHLNEPERLYFSQLLEIVRAVRVRL